MRRLFSLRLPINSGMDGRDKHNKRATDFSNADKQPQAKTQHPAGPNPEKSSDNSADQPLPKGRLWLIGLGGILTLFGGVVIGLYSAVNYLYEAEPDLENQTQIFEVPRGAGLSRIAQDLKMAGLIDKPFIFKLVTKLRGNEANFKAGEYELSTPLSMSDIYDALSEGKAVLYPFTIAEGRTSAQIVRAMKAMNTLTGEIDRVPLEGTVLPETYMTPRGMTRTQLIQKMQKAQKDYIDQIWDGRQKDLPIKTKAEAINLASIVEKETGLGGERDLVAGVHIAEHTPRGV